MQCPRCQHENSPRAKFCEECATPLARTCSNCGTQLLPTAKFCPECARPVDAGAAQPRFAPGAYTPRHLAEKILTSKSALEGERKQVSVLFVDVSGFTSLSERLDPEDVHHLMTRAFELMLAEVHRYEGTVNQFLGDGIMALFGAPIAHEDHAQRAVHAALGIRKALEAYRQELQREGGLRFEVHQGLNTGLVVVGSIGSDLRMDYTAVGDTTNVAARLQQSADPGRIVISKATHRLVEGYFYTRPLGELPLKGKAERIRAWEVISARMTRTRLEVEAERGLTPFVGRERELRLFSECFEKVKAGHGQVVFLVGEPGIGKSRLLYEFRRRLGDEATWLEGYSIPFGQSIAFHPLIDLLKRTFRIEEDDAEATISEKIERSVLLLGEDLRPTLPYIRFLLSVDSGDPAVTRTDPKQRRQGIFDALRRLVIRAAEVRPQVMVYEDIHWMDKAMEESLLFLADSIPTSRILQILTYRTGYAHPFGEHTYHTRIALDTLPAEASVEMVQSMLAAEGLPEELKALIVGKAEGNPFFVEEVVKSLREIGALRREGNRYILARRLDDIVVPDKIQDVIMARIDRLAEAPKKTLQLASVIGREFTRRLLDRISEIRERTEDVLRELKAIELIYDKSLFPELAYMFKHALTQEVAYNSLLVQRRKDLHRIVGLAIEEFYADRLAEHYEVLAHHFSKAEERGKALEYLVKAGDKASAAFANREAVSLCEQALGLLGEDDLAQKADLLQKLATIYLNLADPDASRRCAERALALYEKLGDRRKMVAVHLHLNFIYTWQWDGAREDLGLKHVEAAAAITEEDPDSVEKGLVYQRVGHGYLHRCQPVNTLAWAQRAVDLFRRLNVPMGTSLGTALTYAGRVDEGVGYNEKNWELVLKAASPLIMAVFGHDLSLTLALIKDVSRAREWGERVLPHVVKASPNFEAMIQRPLALSYTLAGDVARAEDACRSVERIESKTLLGCIFEDAAAVGFHYLRRGAWDKAAEYLEPASRRHEDRYTVTAISGCALALGSLRLQMGDYPGAESHLRRSLDLCRSGGNVLFELWVLPVLVEVYLAMGHLGKAGEQVTRGFELLTPDQNWYGLAAAIYLAKGMHAAASKRWDEAEKAFAEAVTINRRHQLPWDEAKTLYEWGLMHVARGRAGNRDTARTKLDAARELFQRVEAKRDIEKVLSVKAQLGG